MIRFVPIFLAAAGLASAEFPSAKVDAAVSELLEKNRLNGACVLISKDGEILLESAYGVADEETGKPMTTGAIFRIHSMTKAITTAVTLMYFEEGKFKPEDPAAKWIPAFAESEKHSKINVADLMRHTAGFGYGQQYDEADVWGGDLNDFAERLATVPLLHDSGKDWNYGLSIDVLGHLIEVWSGQPLAEVFEERIFKPLGMEDTAFYVSEDKKHRLATLYHRKDGELVPDDEARFEPPKAPSGGGGLYSTIGDYHAFLAMILNGGEAPDGRQLLKPETITLMTTNQLPEGIPHIAFGEQERFGVGFGFGFSVVFEESEKWDPPARLGEFGWGGAASCHYWVSPNDKLIVITLEQTRPYDWDLENALKPIVYDAIEN